MNWLLENWFWTLIFVLLIVFHQLNYDKSVKDQRYLEIKPLKSDGTDPNLPTNSSLSKNQ